MKLSGSQPIEFVRSRPLGSTMAKTADTQPSARHTARCRCAQVNSDVEHPLSEFDYFRVGHIPAWHSPLRMNSLGLAGRLLLVVAVVVSSSCERQLTASSSHTSGQYECPQMCGILQP